MTDEEAKAHPFYAMDDPLLQCYCKDLSVSGHESMDHMALVKAVVTAMGAPPGG